MNACQAGRAASALAKLAALVGMCVLAGCGSGGGSIGTGTPDSGAGSTLFVADSLNAQIVSTANANPSAGSLVASRTISGPSASNVMPKMAYDAAADRLYVVNNRSIAVLDNASSRNGLTTPDRMISSASLRMTITSIYLDSVNDLLYVADQALDFLVFSNASTANGSVLPVRTLTITRQSVAVPVNDVYVDTTNDILYISGRVGAGGVNSVILAYNNPRSLNGAVVANRELTFAQSLDDIVGDTANDRLFVSDTGNGAVLVFDNASGIASGPGSPTRTINLSGFAQRLALAPLSDRLYAIIAANPASIQIINGASTAAGSVPVTLVTSASPASFSALAVAP